MAIKFRDPKMGEAFEDIHVPAGMFHSIRPGQSISLSDIAGDKP